MEIPVHPCYIFIHIKENEVHKLFVEPLYQSSGIGGKLLEFAKESFKTDFLWALEKNIRAISFYEKHGFRWDGAERVSEFDGALEVRYVKDKGE